MVWQPMVYESLVTTTSKTSYMLFHRYFTRKQCFDRGSLNGGFGEWGVWYWGGAPAPPQTSPFTWGAAAPPWIGAPAIRNHI